MASWRVSPPSRRCSDRYTTVGKRHSGHHRHQGTGDSHRVLGMPIDLKVGDLVDLTVTPGVEAKDGIPMVEVNYPGLLRDCAVGEAVLVDNELIRLVVVSKDGQRLRCRVDLPGVLGSSPLCWRNSGPAFARSSAGWR